MPTELSRWTAATFYLSLFFVSCFWYRKQCQAYRQTLTMPSSHTAHCQLVPFASSMGVSVNLSLSRRVAASFLSLICIMLPSPSTRSLITCMQQPHTLELKGWLRMWVLGLTANLMQIVLEHTSLHGNTLYSTCTAWWPCRVHDTQQLKCWRAAWIQCE